MARVTIEDCLKVIGNRFELSVLSSFLAKQIERGSLSHLDKNNDKCAVIALREIADNRHHPESLKESYVYSLRKNVLSQDTLEEETSFVETQKVIQEVVADSADSSDESIDDIISVESYDFEDGDEE